MSEKGQARKSMFSVQNMEELGRLYESDNARAGVFLQEADGRGLDARAQSSPRATGRTEPGVAHRGNRKRTMDVSFPALRMDSTQL